LEGYMKKIRITLTMTEQEAEWLEQACFVEEDYPHSKFLNRVSQVARRARHAFQQSVQRTADHVHEFLDSDTCACGATRKQVIERRR
jgi:hypothetical protein